MSDTFTSNYNWTKPENYASDNTWGIKLNQNWDAIDAKIKLMDVLTAAHKAAPVGADKIGIFDSAASDAIKYATLSEALAFLALGTMSTQNASAVDITGGTITGTIAGNPNFTGVPSTTTPAITDDSTKMASTAFVRDIIPAGVVLPFASATIPSGWLECDGTAISRTTYATLFATISTVFGAGNGTTTFNLPDLRGEFIRGMDNGRSTADSGRAFGSAQLDTLKSHTHNVLYNTTGGGGTSLLLTGVHDTTGGQSKPTGVPSTGADAETRPRNVALKYMIKT